MKVAIDARWIFREISGIGTYTESLIKHLAQVDRENQYLLLFDHASLRDRTAEHTQFNTAPNFTAQLVPYGPFSLRNQVLLRGFLTDLHVEVFHSPNYMIPLRLSPREQTGAIRCVVTLHDLIPLLFPDHAPRSKKTRFFPVYKKIMHEVARRADILIAVSEATRRDIIRHLGIPKGREDRVVVVHEGVDTTYTLAGDRSPHEKTVLYVGRLDPYKNVVGLIEAFARARDQLGEKAVLRIIGPEDERYPEARRRCEALGLGEAVQWHGYVTPEQLKHNYQNANVLVLPSRYEGFGLPVLEAMACGTPVICSNQSSLPEIAGEAALLVDPDDIEGLARAITTVLTDAKVAHDLSEAGAKHAAHFRWTRTAEETIRAYEQALALRHQ